MSTPQWVTDTLQTLGGARGLVMIGADRPGRVTYDDQRKVVSIRLPKNAAGAVWLMLTLRNDLYDVALMGRGGKLGESITGLFADQVRPWVEKNTGLYFVLWSPKARTLRNPRTKAKKNPRRTTRRNPTNTRTAVPGTKIVFESLQGIMVPGMIVDLEIGRFGLTEIVWTPTKNVGGPGGYRKGQFYRTSPNWIHPADHVRTSKVHTYVTPVNWVKEKN